VCFALQDHALRLRRPISSDNHREALLKTCNPMKKKTSKKLQLAKVKIASLSKSKQQALNGDMATSIKIACLSQGAEICSEDSCIF
jgi:hypothetical protein